MEGDATVATGENDGDAWGGVEGVGEYLPPVLLVPRAYMLGAGGAVRPLLPYEAAAFSLLRV
jgi:hypothetical protein